MTIAHSENKLSFRLAIRPLTSAMTLSGRATRTEMMSFWLLSIVANAASIVWTGVDPSVRLALDVSWAVLWSWPWIPLLVRRLHDQGRTGWWAMIIVVPCISFATLAHFAIGTPVDGLGISYPGSGPLWVPWSTLTIAIAGVTMTSALTLLVIYFLPDREEGEVYGRDPRLAHPDA